jgi:alpha(1,3/1,4) fucosyltransferase
MKKCLFIYGEHNINNLFDSHASKINLHGQWIALRNKLYELGIELVSNETSYSKSPDLEIHLNVWKTNNTKWPKFTILTETNFIHPDNSDMKKLSKYDHIFSWNQTLVDCGMATKIHFSHPMGNGIVDGFKKRDKFAVLFGSNRSLRGWHPKNDLYSERVKTIKWFERNAPDDFTLYGRKWDMSARLPTRFGGLVHSIEKKIPFNYCPFPSWKGVILNKQDVLMNSRFSIVYENVQGLKGYITEKIFDAFTAGNVPIYWGAEDVNDYIPKKCFIDRRDFSNHENLYKFLKNMSEEEYLNYQRYIKKFLENESGKFTCKKFADVISSKIVEIINNRK